MIKTGIIGCGKVGHLHAVALSKLENSDFVAVCDADIEKAKAFASEYNVAAFSSITEMIKNTSVEAVSICTPHPIHKVAAVEAIENGLHVAIEKPLASSLEDCDDIITAVKKYNVVATAISQRRFYRPSIRLKNAIEEGKIETPILGIVNLFGWRTMDYYQIDSWRGTWQGEGGGVLVNQAPHQLDLLLWYMGEIDELYGTWETLNHPGLEVEDTALAIIRFKNGALGNIVASNSQNPALYGNLRIHGSNGATLGIQTDSGAMFVAGVSSILAPPINDEWTIEGEEELLDKWKKEDSDYFNNSDYMIHYHACQLDDFLSSILEKRQPKVTLEDGRRVVELFTAIYRSKRDNRPIKFPLQPEFSDDFDGRLKKY